MIEVWLVGHTSESALSRSRRIPAPCDLVRNPFLFLDPEVSPTTKLHLHLDAAMAAPLLTGSAPTRTCPYSEPVHKPKPSEVSMRHGADGACRRAKLAWAGAGAVALEALLLWDSGISRHGFP